MHKWVNQSSAIASGKGRESSILLTDHGKDHVDTVIRRAAELCNANEQNILTAYESYVLLLAIQLHDVGNILGRDDHEKKISDVLTGTEASTLLGKDQIEKRMIKDIAMAHGGLADGSGNKDTIGALKYPIVHERNNSDIRTHLLAAILRFADELAEDHTRTSRFLIDNGQIPRICEIYHQYADRLRRLKINTKDRRIDLTFQINEAVAKKKYEKNGRKIYIADEIVARMEKMHTEHAYCNRYMRPYVMVDSINVKVELCDTKYMDVHDTISFSMRESGYPEPPKSISEAWPGVEKLVGKELCEKFCRFKAKKVVI